MDRPGGIAFDKSGKIYVANGGTGGRGIDSITVYAAGSNTNAEPIATIVGTNGSVDKTRLYDPVAVAVDAAGEIYAANAQGDSVTVYALGSSDNIAPVREISGENTWLNLPIGLVIDSSGYLYVLNQSGGAGSAGSISIYAPGSTGNASPVRTISGPRDDDRMGFDYPSSLALDSSNNIYVTNDGSATSYVSKEGVTTYGPDSVTIYAAGSNGNVAPMATIAGPLTQLDSPGGIAVDSIGNIYVANDASGGGTRLDSITLYPPGSKGNVAPAMRLSNGRMVKRAVIKGALTGLDQPTGLAIGPGS